MKMLTGFVAAAVVAGPLAYSAQAVLVKNVTTNTVLLEDTFEDGTLGANPNAAQTGGWLTPSPAVSLVQVQNQAGTGIEAYEGEKFLRVKYRENNDFASPNHTTSNVLIESATFAPGTSGDIIEVSFAVLVDSHAFNLRLLDSGTAVGHVFLMHENHVTEAWQGQVLTTGNTLSGLTHNSDEWNTVVVRYEQGASTFDLSINGSAFVSGTISGTLNQIAFRTAGGVSDFYIDAIPEPASLALLGMGGLMMLRRRRVV